MTDTKVRAENYQSTVSNVNTHCQLKSSLNPRAYTLVSSPSQVSNGEHCRNQWLANIPGFARKPSSRLQEEDIIYLVMKRALTVPDAELRNELLKSYVQYVHPSMPLLELSDFIESIGVEKQGHHLSLLLFQAVMFAATAYIDFKHLQAAGYPSRKAAREAFFMRARNLYDLEYETDTISLIQSLLLMTHVDESSIDQKDSWHWLGVGVSLAYSISLHRDPTNRYASVRHRRMRKRIWWSIYVHDRLLALGMRQPMRIKDCDCDVPMVTTDDFKLFPVTEKMISILGHCEILQDIRHRRQLIIMFIERSKLSVNLGHVLSAQYSTLNYRVNSSGESMMISPQRFASRTSEVQQCDRDLEAWQNHLPPEMKFSPAAASDLPEVEKVMHLHRATLEMIYLATSSALHRPELVHLNSQPGMRALSCDRVRSAATAISIISLDLRMLQLIYRLPATGATVLFAAAISHLYDMTLDDPNAQNMGFMCLDHSIHALQILEETYGSANRAREFLQVMVEKIGTHPRSSHPKR